MKSCWYCAEAPDGPMLTMGEHWAHVDCVAWKLRQLLDPDWEHGCTFAPAPIPLAALAPPPIDSLCRD